MDGGQGEFHVGATALRGLVVDFTPFAKWAGRLGGLTSLQDSVDWQRDLRSDGLSDEAQNLTRSSVTRLSQGRRKISA
jgi:hypothetical protein